MTGGNKAITVLVLGLGNELLTDDGVGVHVVRKLLTMKQVDGVEILDVGTAILHAQSLLEQSAHVIAIDAVRTSDKPGAVCYFDIKQAQINQPVTLHEMGIIGVLNLMAESVRPQVTIVGVEPEVIDYGMELSPAVQASVPRVIQIVQEMIAQLLTVLHGRMSCGTY